VANGTTEATQEQTGLVPLEELESRLDKCRGLLATEPSAMRRTILIAQAVRTARKYIEHCAKDLVDLQGTSLGFAVDKPYTAEELVNPLTEAAIIGLPFVGNCLNVISGRLYIPLGGWEHRFRSDERFSWPRIQLGEVESTEDGRWIDLPEEKWYQSGGKTVKQRRVPGMARVEVIASCQFAGIELRLELLDRRKTGGIDERIAIKVNHGMGDDAVLGKARCRAYKHLWRLAMGTSPRLPGDDGADDPDVIDATAPTSSSATDSPKTETIVPKTETIKDPEPGSYEEFHSLLLRAGTVKVAGEIRDQYGFDGDLAARANEAFARRKSELRQQAEQRT
jgi:hypothetical protein